MRRIIGMFVCISLLLNLSFTSYASAFCPAGIVVIAAEVYLGVIVLHMLYGRTK